MDISIYVRVQVYTPQTSLITMRNPKKSPCHDPEIHFEPAFEALTRSNLRGGADSLFFFNPPGN